MDLYKDILPSSFTPGEQSEKVEVFGLQGWGQESISLYKPTSILLYDYTISIYNKTPYGRNL
jgi:hypothetical protein